MTRKEITEKLYEALTYYYVKKLYSVHPEFGIEKWGRRRLDALCLNYRGEMIGVEVKSCLADYRTDKKWRTYLPYTNKLYFLFPPSVIESRKFPEIKAEIKAEGAGILTLKYGRVHALVGAKTREVDEKCKYQMLVKMAWRGGTTRREIKRAKAVHLE